MQTVRGQCNTLLVCSRDCPCPPLMGSLPCHVSHGLNSIKGIIDEIIYRSSLGVIRQIQGV